MSDWPWNTPQAPTVTVGNITGTFEITSSPWHIQPIGEDVFALKRESAALKAEVERLKAHLQLRCDELAKEIIENERLKRELEGCRAALAHTCDAWRVDSDALQRKLEAIRMTAMT